MGKIKRELARKVVKAARDVLNTKRPPAKTDPTKRDEHDDFIWQRKRKRLIKSVVAYTNARLMNPMRQSTLTFDARATHYSFPGAKRMSFSSRTTNYNGREHKNGRDVEMRLILSLAWDTKILARRVMQPASALATLQTVPLWTSPELVHLRFKPDRRDIDAEVAIAPALRALWHRESRFSALPEELKEIIMRCLLGLDRKPSKLITF